MSTGSGSPFDSASTMRRWAASRAVYRPPVSRTLSPARSCSTSASESGRCRRCSATLGSLRAPAADPQDDTVRLLYLLEGEERAADGLLVHESGDLLPQRIRVAAKHELVPGGGLPLLRQRREQSVRVRPAALSLLALQPAGRVGVGLAGGDQPVALARTGARPGAHSSASLSRAEWLKLHRPDRIGAASGAPSTPPVRCSLLTAAPPSAAPSG